MITRRTLWGVALVSALGASLLTVGLVIAVGGIGTRADRARPSAPGPDSPPVTAVVNDAPEPFHLAGPLEPVLARLLDKDPSKRPSPGDVKGLLAEVQDGSVGRPGTFTRAK